MASAKPRASVDLPPPALPNTATFLMLMLADRRWQGRRAVIVDTSGAGD